ncbi:MAG TPA: 2-dehydropantoate 2-reductase [Chitinophagales bacterium]|nr:2-dehydropantoate 2-reductase [Chitinophagales bacterium]
MAAKFKIAILGLGGVGGFVGGKLALHYANSDIEVAFIARGENEKAIKARGLLLITSQGEETIHPSIVTSQPELLGVMDLIVCCSKNFDLEASIKTLGPCISQDTVILPLLNGVDASERIRKLFPQAEIWDGCMYIVSRLVAPGIVRVTGNPHSLYFGSHKGSQQKLKHVETIFKSAGINANLSDDISKTVWEKFLFISPLATLTSYLDLPIGGIVSNHEYKELLLNLLIELKNVADAKGLLLPEEIIQKTMDRMISLPGETTSSMHSDFKKGGKTEVESLTGYVVHQGKDLNIPTPNYEKIFAILLAKSNASVA